MEYFTQWISLIFIQVIQVHKTQFEAQITHQRRASKPSFRSIPRHTKCFTTITNKTGFRRGQIKTSYEQHPEVLVEGKRLVHRILMKLNRGFV